MKKSARQQGSQFEQRRSALYDRLREKHPELSDTVDELIWLDENIEKQKVEQITSGPYAGITQTFEAIMIWLEENGNKPTMLETISEDLIRRGIRAGFKRATSNYVAAGLFKLGIRPQKAFAVEEMPFLCSEEDLKSRNPNPVIWLNPDYRPKRPREGDI